eukprot:3142283-Alexandrium_andersonii.AAC.1
MSSPVRSWRVRARARMACAPLGCGAVRPRPASRRAGRGSHLESGAGRQGRQEGGATFGAMPSTGYSESESSSSCTHARARAC